MNKIGMVIVFAVVATVAGLGGYAVAHVVTGQAEVRISARQLDDGRVEFALQQRVDGQWGDRLLAAARYFPSEVTHSRWLNSSPYKIETLSEPGTGLSGNQSSAGVRLSGNGVSVQSIKLADGVYFCDVSVSGNSESFGGTALAVNFIVVFEGRSGGYELLANEIAASWSGRKKVTVGDGIFDLSGTIDVEVTAAPQGRWSIDCRRQ